MADSLLTTMRQIGYEVTEENPFEENIRIPATTVSPYASRIRLMWRKMRQIVISLKESAGIAPREVNLPEILSNMDATYIKDSYNSLSIEGYKVTEELLERVRSGEWDPKKDARQGALFVRLPVFGVVHSGRPSPIPLPQELMRRRCMSRGIKAGTSSCLSRASGPVS